MHIPPGAISMVGEELPKLLHREGAAFSSALLDPAYPGGRIAVDFLPVHGLPEYYLHDAECLVYCSWCILCKQSGAQVEYVGKGDLGEPFVSEGVRQDMLSESLLLNLCIPTSDTFALFAQTTDMRAVVPIEIRTGILAECLVFGQCIYIPSTCKKVLKKNFGVSLILTAGGVPGVFVVLDEAGFAVEPVVPVFITLDQVVEPSHDVSFALFCHNLVTV